MSAQPPRPTPPSTAFLASRALIREQQLTRAERAARDSVTPPRNRGEAPGERIAPFGPVLAEAGWKVETTVHPLRARLEAFHSSGAVVMITSDVRSSKRGGVRAYFLRRPGVGWWRRLRTADLPYFAEHADLPPSAPEQPLVGTSKCRCGKVQHPTAARAAAALEDITTVRAAQPDSRPPETRSYRCEADDRVWHLTSKPTGYTHPTPLADAFPHSRHDRPEDPTPDGGPGQGASRRS
ncbi:MULTISPECIES: hypothetical protein [Streptomyces]|uniref:Uncharacterized protein n=2 Tax=Streptomyces TaxID=1883 RepID=A0ABU4KFW1_9ACTN|nr:hypothetical protein [Streptomyces roseolus]MDX2296631.1 hypothetical protein [Streptomyces roseolus]